MSTSPLPIQFHAGDGERVVLFTAWKHAAGQLIEIERVETPFWGEPPFEIPGNVWQLSDPAEAPGSTGTFGVQAKLALNLSVGDDECKFIYNDILFAAGKAVLRLRCKYGGQIREVVEVQLVT